MIFAVSDVPVSLAVILCANAVFFTLIICRNQAPFIGSVCLLLQCIKHLFKLFSFIHDGAVILAKLASISGRSQIYVHNVA